LYEAFPADEALRLSKKLEIHYTSKHGSWLNVAEIELSAYKRQCLPERIPSLEEMRALTQTWNKDSPRWTSSSIKDARIKLKRLYPKI
jgi:hypothetical protein